MRTGGSSVITRIVNAVVLIVNLLLSVGLIVSGYCGCISPETFKYAPLAVMSFPIWLLCLIVVFVIDLIWWRRIAIVAGVAMLVCLPQVADVIPLNMPHWGMSEEQKSRSFTLMTYNVMQFKNQDTYATRYTNEQLDYIIEKQPDVVCIEEARCLSPNDDNHITQDQLADLGDIYPYIYIDGEQLAFLSKFEAEPIPIDFPDKDFASGSIGAWRLHIDGEVVNVFVVHLRSFMFSDDEKNLFRDMTTPDRVNANELRNDLRNAKRELLPKVIDASDERAGQIEMLVRYIKKYGGENVIVCGDFNDPICGYTLNVLQEESNLKQVYSEVGFGPMITYSAHHFYFRIDHILYRGNLHPWSISRGNIKASDHYPLLATFVLEANKN